jgi:predicted cupin superfamily sugar epimerase
VTAEEVIELLNLQAHPMEGGYFRETYRTAEKHGNRSLSTAIYYLLSPKSISAMHRLPGDEVFHFYLGDPVNMLQLWPDGTTKIVTLGTDLRAGQLPQAVVPGGVWQGSLLADGGNFALLGTTMAPGFDYADYETGKREELMARYPEAAGMIGRRML